MTLCTLGCANLQTDPSNCGACGRQCPTLYCGGGQCSTDVCLSPRVMCGSVCVDLSSDEHNCGACGRRCFGSCGSGLCISEPADAAFDVAVDTGADADGGGDASDAEASTDASDAGRRRDSGRP